MEWEKQHGANIFAEATDLEMAEYLGKKNESLQNQVCSTVPTEKNVDSRVSRSDLGTQSVQHIRTEDGTEALRSPNDGRGMAVTLTVNITMFEHFVCCAGYILVCCL